MPNAKQLMFTAGLGYAAYLATRGIVRQSRTFDWTGKRVLITGGSRGLGLVLARKLASQGARLVLFARTDDDLETAADELQSLGAEVLAINCDVGEQEQVAQGVAEANKSMGAIDVLINVAGIIEVGPFDAMTTEDFYNSMQTNCWGALHTIKEVLPGMRRQGWGRIMNVASLGGKRAVPHMLPYAASKFALVGLSNGLRAELKHENILVSTACPGLMRTGSPRNALFKGRHRAEYAWFSIGDSLPLLSMSAEQAAAQILKGCQHGRGEFIVSNPLNIAVKLQHFFPQITADCLALMDQLLPTMGGIGKQAARGYESESRWSPSFLTTLSQKAAVENNQL